MRAPRPAPAPARRLAAGLLLTTLMAGGGLLSPAAAHASGEVIVSGTVSGPAGVVVSAGVDVRRPDGAVVAHTTTDTAGGYSTPVAPGEYDIRVEPPTGASLVPSETAVQDVSTDTVVDVDLYDVPTLRGEVTGTDGPLGLAGGIVTDDSSTSFGTDGRYVLRTSAGNGKTVRGSASGPGVHYDFEGSIDVTASRPLGLTLPLRPLVVHVLSHDQEPVEGCHVRSWQDVQSGLPAPLTSLRSWMNLDTDGSGSTVLRMVVDPSPAVVSVYCETYPVAVASVTPSVDDTLTVALPATVQVTAHIAGQDGPLDLQLAELRLDTALGTLRPDGSLLVNAEPGTDRRLAVDAITPDGEYAYFGRMDVGTQDMVADFVLPTLRQQVQVVDADGAGVGGCSVRTSQSATAGVQAPFDYGMASLLTTTDASGAAEIRMLDTPETDITATCEGYPVSTAHVVPSATQVLTLSLPRVAVVEGRITDGAGTLLQAGLGLMQTDDTHAEVTDGLFSLHTTPGTAKQLSGYFQTPEGTFNITGTLDVPDAGASTQLKLPLTPLGVTAQRADGEPAEGCWAQTSQELSAGLEAPLTTVEAQLYADLDSAGRGVLRMLDTGTEATVRIGCEGYPSTSVSLVPGGVAGVRVVFGGATPAVVLQSKPVVTGTLHGPGQNGWYRDDVTVSWVAATNDSALEPVSRPADSLVTAEGRDQLIVSGPACDTAGQCSTGTARVSIDRTAPTGTAELVGGPVEGSGWHRSATIHFTCEDALSGVASCPADATVPDGVGETVTGEVIDMAGNSTLVTSAPVDVDATAPTLTYTLDPTAPAGSNGWNTQPVTVHWTCNDAVSGVATCPPDSVLSSDGTRTVTGVATDVAGNTTTVTTSPIKVDRTGPVVTNVRTGSSPNADGWYAGPVTFRADCTDEVGSGVASCPSVEVTGSGSGLTSTLVAVDLAGNETRVVTPAINIDTTVPTVAITTLAPVALKERGSILHGRAGDGVSGVKRVIVAFTPKAGGVTQVKEATCPLPGLTCDWTVSWGSDIPRGAYTVTAWSVDYAGNRSAPSTLDLMVSY